MLFISHMCMIRDNTTTPSVTKREEKHKNRRDRNRDRNRNTENKHPQASRAELKYRSPSPAQEVDRPPRPYMSAQWDRVLSIWRPPIPDKDWDRYISLSASAKRAYVSGLPTPKVKTEKSTPQPKPHVPYATPYKRPKGPTRGKGAPSNPPTHRPHLRSHRFDGSYSDTKRRGHYSRKGKGNSTAPSTFTPGDHQVLTAMADDYVTDDEDLDADDTLAVLTHDNAFQVLPDVAPPPRPKNGKGEG